MSGRLLPLPGLAPHEEALRVINAGGDRAFAASQATGRAAEALDAGDREAAAYWAAVANYIIGERFTRESMLDARGAILNAINEALE